MSRTSLRRWAERQLTNWPTTFPTTLRIHTGDPIPTGPVYSLPPYTPAITGLTHMQVGDTVLERQPDGTWIEVGRGAVTLVLDQDGASMVLTEQGESQA